MSMVIDPISVILTNEGGYQPPDPNDPRSPRKYGITEATLRVWLGHPATVRDVQNLDVATAREIYEKNYLSGPRIDLLPDPPQTCVLDVAVNRGPRVGIKMLQQVLNQLGFACVIDGVMGPQTQTACIQAVAQLSRTVQNTLVDARIAFYKALVAADPRKAVFLTGWITRAQRFYLPG